MDDDLAPTRILLTDDHALFACTLETALRQEADFEVVGCAREGREAVKLALAQVPDVVVMDVTMPVLNGIDATRQIKKEAPGVKVLGLSMHLREEFVLSMLEAGASGYMLKTCKFSELVECLRCIAAGQAHFCPEVSGLILNYLQAERNGAAPPDKTLLSPREREILQLIVEEFTNKQIAQELNISLKTVESHRAHIIEKLRIRTVAGLTKYAIREGLTPME